MDRKVFFDHVRAPLFAGGLSKSQVEGLETLLSVVEGWDLRWQAYALATAYGETARTMRPIAEYGKGRGRKYGKPGRHKGQVAYGRGYVQLTWADNYAKADMKLGLGGRLVDDYELALDPEIAAKILRRGMEEGWFTGMKLGDYFRAGKTDWRNARRIINGTDKASSYAKWAQAFHRALQAAGAASAKPIPTGKKPLVVLCMGTNDWANPANTQENTQAVIRRLQAAGLEVIAVAPTNIAKLKAARKAVIAAIKQTGVDMIDPEPSTGADAIHMSQAQARKIAALKPDYAIGDSNAVRVAMARGWNRFDHAEVGAGTDAIRSRVEADFKPKTVPEEPGEPKRSFWSKLVFWR